MSRFSVSAAPLDCPALSRSIVDNAAGAFVSFEGWVRDNNEGHAVTALEYEVFHELAIYEGNSILDEAIARFGLADARAVHREGRLGLGDCAVWVGVTARHRGEAFSACRHIMDEIKHRLPVWKKEHYVGLEPQWVNCRHIPPAPAGIGSADYYARQIRLPEIGESGQRKLAAAKVLVVGVGGLGCAAASCLAAAGIGKLGLADPDHLAASNLHRQTIYNAADIGKPKAVLAAAYLRSLNPLITVKAMEVAVTTDNVAALLDQYDLVLDCTDNFPAKYLLNDAAVTAGKLLVQASIYRFEGQLLVIDGNNDAGCLRCLFPSPPPGDMIGDCAETGVLGTVPALFGTLQANEAIKYILDLGVSSDMLLFDLLSLESRRLKRARDLDCTVCAGKVDRNGTFSESNFPADFDFVVDPLDTDQALRARFRFVDVRESEELLANPLGNALHMPTSAFDPSILGTPDNSPLLLICAKGVRSRRAAEYMRAEGWTQAYSLAGGLDTLPSGLERRQAQR